MIVGRSADLERLDRLIGRLASGHGGRLLVVGDPGIGKTALLDVAQRRAAARGTRVVHVRGVDGEDDLRFALLDDLHRVLGRAAPPPYLGVAGRGEALLQALVSVVADLPLLLVVDDAQFADDATLAALGLALERGQDLPVLALVAMRADRGAVTRFARWTCLRLGPLDEESSRALLRSVLGPGCPATVVAAMAGALGGNPLALREAPRLLRAEELAGLARLPDPLPVAPLVAQAWGTILDRLPPSTDAALLDLAVVGARPNLYAALRPDARAVEDLEPATAAGLVTLSSSCGPSFVHPLVRDVVRHRAGTTATCARHAAAAAVAAAQGLPPSVRLHHLVRSTLLADAGVATALVAVAERAEELDQGDTAIAAWEAAARLSTTTPDRVARGSRGLGVVIRTGVSSPAIPALLEHVAGAVLDPEMRAWVTVLRAELVATDDPAAAVPALWSAVERTRTSSPDLLPALLWGLAATAWQQGLPADGSRAAETLVALADESPDAGTAPAAWITTALRAAALFQAGEVAAAVPLRREAGVESDSVDPETCDLIRLVDAVFLDDLLLDPRPSASHRLQVLVRRLAAEAEPRASLWGIEAWRARARGELDTASRRIAEGRVLIEALADPRAGAALGTASGLCALAVEIAAITGDDSVLHDEVAQLRALTDRIHDRRRRATGDRAVGLRALVAGRLDEAVASLSAAADVDFLGRGLRDAVLPARVDLVEAYARLGDPVEARHRADAVRPVLDAMDDPPAAALSERVAGLVARSPASAATHFDTAVRFHTRGGDPFEHGRTLLLQGEHLRRHHRRSEARAALLGASVLFERLGARPWVERVQAELRAAGGTPTTGGSAAALTPQELAVARAVVSGRSNREVGEALFLSPRTVEYHLGNVYRKLGVHGRAGVAGAIVDLLPAGSLGTDPAVTPADRPGPPPP